MKGDLPTCNKKCCFMSVDQDTKDQEFTSQKLSLNVEYIK